jgi:hypothetical protein
MDRGYDDGRKRRFDDDSDGRRQDGGYQERGRDEGGYQRYDDNYGRYQERGREDWGSPPPWWREQHRREEKQRKKKADTAGARGQQQQGERGSNPKQQKNKGKGLLGGNTGAGQSQQSKGKNKNATPTAVAGVECFKCGREGHYQASCTFDPLCIICRDEGHTSANCPTRGRQMRLQTMGHAISGGVFFNIDVEPMKNEPRPGEVFAAIIKFNDSPLTKAKLADELKHLIDELWNWQERKLTASEFAVVFPSKETLRMGTRSGRMFPPLSKSEVSIREAFMAPRPSLLLPSVWVQLTGVPENLLERERLMAAFVMVGRLIDVDELSVQKWDREPIRMRFHFRYPERIKGTIQICVNGEGFMVGVQAELGQRGRTGGSGRPPKPPSDDLGEFDLEERSSDEET